MIGEKIRAYRIKKNMRQLDLEVAINTSCGTLSRIENGLTNPTKETILNIASVLKLNKTETADLFGINNFESSNSLDLEFIACKVYEILQGKLKK